MPNPDKPALKSPAAPTFPSPGELVVAEAEEIPAPQGPVLDQLNNVFFPNAWDPYERGLRLDANGVCHSYIALSIAIPNFRTRLRHFLDASDAEKIQLGTEVNYFGGLLAYYLAAFQFLVEPYKGVTFAKLPQKDILLLAGLKILGEYSVQLPVKELADVFAILGDEPCTIFFSLNVHAIKVTYENKKIYILDPNTGQNKECATPLEAARHIFEIFLKVNNMPLTTSEEMKFNAELYLVKREVDPALALPKDMMLKLERMQFRDLTKTLAGRFYRHNIKYISAATSKQYKENLELRTDHKALLQLIPSEVTEQVLRDPYFINMLNDPNAKYDPTLLANMTAKEYRRHTALMFAARKRVIPPTGIEAIIEHYHPGHAGEKIKVDKQLIASTIYLLVKRHGHTLEDLLLEDYNKHHDSRLLKTLPKEKVYQLALTSNDANLWKIAMEDIAESTTQEQIVEAIDKHNYARACFELYDLLLKNNVVGINHYLNSNRNKTFFPDLFNFFNQVSVMPWVYAADVAAMQRHLLADIFKVMNKFYRTNAIDDARAFIVQNLGNPYFRETLAQHIDNLAHLALVDNKVEIFLLMLDLNVRLGRKIPIDCLLSAMDKDRLTVLEPLIDKMQFADIEQIQPFLYAAWNSSYAVLSTLIDYFRKKDPVNKTLLRHFLQQSNEYAETALHIAAYKGKKDYKGTKEQHVKLLLDAMKEVGIETEWISLRNQTPLYIACAKGHVETALSLLQEGVFNFTHMLDSQVTIFEAAKNSGNAEMLPKLIEFFRGKYSVAELYAKGPHVASYFFTEPQVLAAPVPIPQAPSTPKVSPLSSASTMGDIGLKRPLDDDQVAEDLVRQDPGATQISARKRPARLPSCGAEVEVEAKANDATPKPSPRQVSFDPS